MIFNLKKKINKILFNFTGYQIRKIDKKKEYFKDEPHLDKDFFKVCSKIEKIYHHDCIHETNYTAYNLVKNAIYQNIKGCIIECGVFQGEKISVIIETLKLLNVYDKNIYVIDTFQGMTEPSSSDYQVIHGNKMKEKDMLCTLEKVKKNIF